MHFTRQLRTAVSKVSASNPYISVLLKEIKDVTEAKNELRWMREFVESSSKARNKSKAPILQPLSASKTSDQHNLREQLMTLCERRARGEPLQYILGSQPFGDLDITCKPGVLIPRPETEAYTTYLASKICNGLFDKQFKTLVEKANNHATSKELSSVPEIRMLDACSGSGCISLLLHNLLFEHCKAVGKLRIDGLDVSKVALDLSRENLEQNITSGALNPLASADVQFRNYDIYSGPWNTARKELKPYHIIMSNPPYISQEEYETTIPRSVREWEPKAALVPEKLIDEYPNNYHLADRFYYALMAHYHTSMQSAFMMVMEIGDEAQAKRVLEMAMKEFHLHESNDLSVWRDSPDARPSGDDLAVDKIGVPTEGQGNVRVVVLVRHMNQIQWIDDERHKSTRASSKNPM